MSRNVLETILGAVVLATAVGFGWFAYDNSNVKAVQGYHVVAEFSNASGVSSGSEVVIGGVKIGVVDALSLDPERYVARVQLQIKDGIALPKDSSAAIVSDGLIGGKFIALEPGADEAMLKDGDVIRYTQSSVSFEELIGKFVFSSGGVDSDDVGAAAADVPGSLAE